MTKQLTINGDVIDDIPSFYQEINRVFMHSESWEIGNSLDAFDDLLYGGFGEIRNDEPVELTWYHAERSRQMLGFDTTKAYYLEKLRPGSPYNHAHFQAKLASLESGGGETYFDILIQIITSHPNIRLILR